MSSRNNVLEDIKKLLGIDYTYTHFDTDILIHLNSSMFTLYQLGYNYNPVANTTTKLSITKDTTWTELFNEQMGLDFIKTLLYLKVKLVFDPPANSFTIDAIKNIINEYEWRLHVELDKDRVINYE